MTTGIVMVLVPHILLIAVSRSLYFDSITFTLVDVFVFRRYGHVYKDACFLFLVFDDLWPIGYFPANLDIRVP